MKNSAYRNISIWLDSYDDIFSDFDPRPFSDRNISDDFLYEVKKVTSENEFDIAEFKLLIPEKVRKKEHELIISNRLHQYFKTNEKKMQRYKTVNNQKGALFISIGTCMMGLASYVSSLRSDLFVLHMALVIFEPAGWFMMWTGLDSLFHSFKKHKPEMDFYAKISRSKIIFVPITS